MRVGVVVLKSFLHHGCMVHPGADVQLTPLDAAVKAQAGLVSLLHGDRGIYATRDMVAAPSPVAVALHPSPAIPTSAEPPRRKRGRPRKAR